MSFGYQALGFGSGYGGVNLLTGLVSWWPHEEATGIHYDSHGSNNLTNNNTVTTGTGIKGNAAAFAAATSESLSKAAGHGLHGSDRDFTFATWVYIGTGATDKVIASVSLTSSIADNDWMIYYTAGIPNFYMGVGSSWANIGATTFGALTTFTWYCLFAEYDAGHDTMRISINLVEDAATSVSAPNNAGGPFYLGRWAGGNYHNGRIDESAFWSRLLTSDEKAAYYNSGAGITYTDL